MTWLRQWCGCAFDTFSDYDIVAPTLDMVAHLVWLRQQFLVALLTNMVAFLTLGTINMVVPSMDMVAVGTAHLKWLCSCCNASTMLTNK